MRGMRAPRGWRPSRRAAAPGALTVLLVAHRLLAAPATVPPTDLETDRYLVAEVAAAAPDVIHPLAIDWDTAGRLYVAEWVLGESGPGTESGLAGRVRLLADGDGDGRYEPVAVFLDQLPLVTSVKAWGRGLLLIAAPDLVYAEDTDGDRQADQARRWVVGFGAELPVQRANSLSWGLDGWIHVANGLGDGVLRALPEWNPFPGWTPPADLKLAGSDCRFRPETGQLEATAGLSQVGRARTDFDDWLGGDAQGRLWHFPLPAPYLRRNPAVAYPDPAVLLNATFGDQPVIRSGAGEAEPQSAATEELPAAGWLTVYRDQALGASYAGNLLQCVPALAQVRRWMLDPRGASFQATPAERPFLSSTDPRFCPVQVATGPDGAVWIVDAQLGRRGASPPTSNMPAAGRLLRVRSAQSPPRAVEDLAALQGASLVAAFRSANGPTRDRAHAEILRRRDPRLVSPLAEALLPSTEPSAAVRAQALHLLNALGGLSPENITAALTDPDPDVRRIALRLVEPRLESEQRLPAEFEVLSRDPDGAVRFQLALTLGASESSATAVLLDRLLSQAENDPWIQAAILSSARNFAGHLLRSWLDRQPPESLEGRTTAEALLDTALAGEARLRDITLNAISNTTASNGRALRLHLGARLLDRSASSPTADAGFRDRLLCRLAPLMAYARELVSDPSAAAGVRAAAVGLLGWEPAHRDPDLQRLAELLSTGDDIALREAAARALVRQPSTNPAAVIVGRWLQLRPSLRPPLVGALVSRDEWLPSLLNAVGQGSIAATEITPANRERLRRHADQAIRERTEAVLAAVLPPARRAVLEGYNPALHLEGTTSRGRELFLQRCTGCHSLAGRGHAVGPDLAIAERRTPSELAQSILDPNATIEPRYLGYQVETAEDDAYHGILAGESEAQLTLMQGSGVRQDVPTSSITQIRVSNYSPMPEGLEAGWTPQDLADLIAFLQTARGGR